MSMGKCRRDLSKGLFAGMQKYSFASEREGILVIYQSKETSFRIIITTVFSAGLDLLIDGYEFSFKSCPSLMYPVDTLKINANFKSKFGTRN